MLSHFGVLLKFLRRQTPVLVVFPENAGERRQPRLRCALRRYQYRVSGCHWSPQSAHGADRQPPLPFAGGKVIGVEPSGPQYDRFRSSLRRLKYDGRRPADKRHEISRHHRRSRVVGSEHILRPLAPARAAPQFAPGARVETYGQQTILLAGGDVQPGVRDNGRGLGIRNGRLPDDILRWRELDGVILRAIYARCVRTPEAGPLRAGQSAPDHGGRQRHPGAAKEWHATLRQPTASLSSPRLPMPTPPARNICRIRLWSTSAPAVSIQPSAASVPLPRCQR